MTVKELPVTLAVERNWLAVLRAEQGRPGHTGQSCCVLEVAGVAPLELDGAGRFAAREGQDERLADLEVVIGVGEGGHSGLGGGGEGRKSDDGVLHVGRRETMVTVEGA